ncbi:hypothetical protein SAMN05428949_1055 [Chitinophaga sp. YR627]|uniref:hypothetical protein n=1 Tax=Chitinophaga sp. YR627 TaxID=1881041 RepID=UPI0008ED2BDC|nr:hypothetical protein [Chitinophaga sp. YR627]SFM85539.1 hypothetical protein SAMN05428949_1055 [Chitinophaga sp. YR627]
MSNQPLRSSRAKEALRQARKAFNQNELHVQRWFRLKITLGYATVVILAVILILSAVILLNHHRFNHSTVFWAGRTLFRDVPGVVLTVWKITLHPQFVALLEPVIKN